MVKDALDNWKLVMNTLTIAMIILEQMENVLAKVFAKWNNAL